MNIEDYDKILDSYEELDFDLLKNNEINFAKNEDISINDNNLKEKETDNKEINLKEKETDNKEINLKEKERDREIKK